jgi:hypothetical protein
MILHENRNYATIAQQILPRCFRFYGALEQTTEKTDFKRILTILVIVLVDLMDFPLSSRSCLCSRRVWRNATLIGILQATYPMMQFVGAPILGRFRIGSGASLS